MATLHLLEDCDRPQAWRCFEHWDDIGIKNSDQWIRSTPATRHRLL
jgi:hypothetical protein